MSITTSGPGAVIGDEDLYERFRRGDGRAFETLYQRHRPQLYRYLRRLLGDEGEAQDLYQEVWLRVIHAREPFRAGLFRPYLYRIGHNLAIDRLRRRHLHLVSADDECREAVADPAPTPERQVEDEDCRRRLLSGLEQLPQEQREAFLLKEEGGLSLEQIALVAAVGRETIKSRLRYAMTRLRQLLEDCL